MENRTRGILQILSALGTVIVVLFFTNDIRGFAEWGYAGIFIISAVSSATLFFPAPGWAAVIATGRILDAHIVGVLAGTGSAIGELTGYVAGRGAAEIIPPHTAWEKYKMWIQKNDIVSLFILAFIPNPLFDLAGLAAGSMGIPVWRYLLATAAGRSVRYVLLAYLGAFSVLYI